MSKQKTCPGACSYKDHIILIIGDTTVSNKVLVERNIRRFGQKYNIRNTFDLLRGEHSALITVLKRHGNPAHGTTMFIKEKLILCSVTEIAFYFTMNYYKKY
jgi:hypothetical protein